MSGNGKVVKLVQPNPPGETLAISATGMKIVIPQVHNEQHFVYCNKLWAVNQEASQRAARPVYCEVTQSMVDDMRRQAALVNEIASLWEAQLKTFNGGLNGVHL